MGDTVGVGVCVKESALGVCVVEKFSAHLPCLAYGGGEDVNLGAWVRDR